MFELHHLTAHEQWDWLHRGQISPTELTEYYLGRIERLDARVGAFTTVTPELALARARHVQRAYPRTAALWGLPLADKDLSRRAGVRTTMGSRLYRDAVPDESDEIVEVLDRAGAISLGKTSTPEFGLSGYTEPVLGPVTRNPWDARLGVGGSSGGAAAAVAAGLLPFAPGSDGGGSVRIPAAATGLVGLKPSRGLVPAASGVDGLAGLVVTGAITRTVADAAMLLDAMVAAGPYPFAVRAPRLDDGPLLAAAVRGDGRYQIGVLTESPWGERYDIRAEADATDAVDVAVREIDALGHGLEAVGIERGGYAEFFTTLWQAGAAAVPVADDQLDQLEPLSRWLIERGRAIGARRLVEALAAASAFERAIIRRFAGFDAVLTPALAQTPRPLGWYDRDDPERNFEQQVRYSPYTSLANVAGLPAITLPVHRNAAGLPMGVQLIGRPGGEAALLAIGAQLERRLHWQLRHPPVWAG